MNRKTLVTRLLVVLALFFVTTKGTADDLFRDHVAPIFERRCVTCHSDQQREGGFSLQSATELLSGGSIVPGDAEASYLMALIAPSNRRAEMPKDADPLSTEEIAKVRDWIDGGAVWPDGLTLEAARVDDFSWWSFQPVNKPVVPKLDTTWGRTPVDAFVLKQLRRRKLVPSQEADRRTLIRRLTFDLIGLPPTPDEVETFVNDPNPLAYEDLVDRLLDSKHYGERWARHWLDVVKYADTAGYDKDKLRPNAWPYRDYVIRSLNDDKPYSRFVQEQIAGDVLFPHESDGIVALGFIAAGPWDFIGHVEVPESKIDGKVARNLDRDDMVSNTINTFCSVTIQCARCHNHKFDPFTQEDYYGLQAVFSAIDRADRPYDSDPQVAENRNNIATRLVTLRESLQSLDQEIGNEAGPRLSELKTKIAEIIAAQSTTQDPAFGYHSEIAALPDATKWIELTLPQAVDLTQVVLHPCHDDFAGIGAGFGFPIRFIVEVTADANVEQPANWIRIADHREQPVANPGLTPFKIACQTQDVRRIRITATELAERQDDYIFALAEVCLFNEINPEANLAREAVVNSLDSIEAPVRWSRSNLVDGKWAKQTSTKDALVLKALELEHDAILSRVDTPTRKARRASLLNRIVEAEQELKSLPQPALVYAAATEFSPSGNFQPTSGKPRPIHVLLRGDVQNFGEAVGPGLLPLGVDHDGGLEDLMPESKRRAALARSLTCKDNPLVWRSIVNRVWQYHFGTGIVATPNDFGRMGAQPTDPDLLDWLAAEFRDGGEWLDAQSLKSLHRLMVNSSVYRQASDFNSPNAAIDGGNQFLWRMERRRLTAEEIRDSILAVSGSLDKTMGGPGFYLFELESPEHSPHYQYHKFDPADLDSHRRSIYRFIVRSQPNPWMTTLDCADSSQSTPLRNETLTSLQALTLLNNPFNLVMAERFAERLERQAATLDQQIELAVRLLAQRNPTGEEREELSAYAEQHGLTQLCRFLFNLSEFVYVD